MFIVRDWYNDDEDIDYPHGLNGGKQYFSAATQPNAKKANEHILMHEFLQDAFGDIACFLLPEPGNAVRQRDVILESKHIV